MGNNDAPKIKKKVLKLLKVDLYFYVFNRD